MTCILKATFPSNTNLQLAKDSLDSIGSVYTEKDDCLIFSEELSYEENTLIHSYSGDVKKCKSH